MRNLVFIAMMITAWSEELKGVKISEVQPSQRKVSGLIGTASWVIPAPRIDSRELPPPALAVIACWLQWRPAVCAAFAFHYSDAFIRAAFVDLINQSLISQRDLFNYNSFIRTLTGGAR